uniref:Putative secreted protein n=1 Tax=Anopheles marajoara TaxID=58244 RepID=A0A2M4CA96_9DIPT
MANLLANVRSLCFAVCWAFGAVLRQRKPPTYTSPETEEKKLKKKMEKDPPNGKRSNSTRCHSTPPLNGSMRGVYIPTLVKMVRYAGL